MIVIRMGFDADHADYILSIFKLVKGIELRNAYASNHKLKSAVIAVNVGSSSYRIAKYPVVTFMDLCTKSTKHHTFNHQLRIHSDNVL